MSGVSALFVETGGCYFGLPRRAAEHRPLRSPRKPGSMKPLLALIAILAVMTVVWVYVARNEAPDCRRPTCPEKSR